MKGGISSDRAFRPLFPNSTNPLIKGMESINDGNEILGVMDS